MRFRPAPGAAMLMGVILGVTLTVIVIALLFLSATLLWVFTTENKKAPD